MPYTTTLTDGGKEMLRSVLLNQGEIIFTHLAVGSGTPHVDTSDIEALDHWELNAPLTSIDRGAGYFVRIVSTVTNTSISNGFEITELGLYAKANEEDTPILYTYVGITDNDGGWIPPGENILIEREYTINVFVGDALDVQATIDTQEAATKAELQAHNVSTVAHENRFSLKQDKTNLLSDVPDGGLNEDYDVPMYSDNFGHRKLKLSDLMAFFWERLTITISQLPTITVKKGGTGRTTLTTNSVLVGNGTSTVKMVGPSQGTFYNTSSSEAPRFGTLPVSVGGTGNTDGYIRTGLKSGVSVGGKATSEGNDTSATGDNSHAEGNSTVAYGNNSHAEGYGTIANSRSQHVFGEYNVADTQNKSGQANYAEIVGGGTASARKNIRTLKWDGTEEIAGSFLPSENNAKDIGSSAKKWKNIFATTLNGILSKKVTFNNSGSGAASGASFDGGSADVVVSYNTVGAAAASHNHTPAQISSNGTLGAYVSAKASTPLGNAYVRNIYAGTADMTPGTTSLAYGTIYLVYE